MNTIRTVQLKLSLRKWQLRLCVALLSFSGLAFLLKYFFIEPYGTWREVFAKGREKLPDLVNAFRQVKGSVSAINGISTYCLVLLAVIVFIFLLFLLSRFIWRKITRRRGISCNCDNPISVVSDAPIKTSAEDEFSRGAYVRMLSTLIMSSPNGREARYIGIYAPWGDGKTSVRFLLEERMRSDYGENSAIIVDFSPWQYPESADIRMLFFERLATAVAKAGSNDVSTMSSMMAKYLAMTRINRTVGPLHDVIDCLRKLFLFGFFSEESLTTDFRELLCAMKKKIVVVVDDLDRLSEEEICRVIRFLKANGDLPNITYLILADEGHLANAVASLVTSQGKNDIDSGREYLKKIIPLRCPLPLINGTRLLNSFKRHLSILLTGFDLEGENPRDSCDWLLSAYMRNARIGKEILNAFSIKVATYLRQFAGRKYFGVNIGDLLALTIIEIYEPDIYKELRDMYGKFLDDPWQGHKWDNGISEQWMEEHIFQHACSGREVIEKFLSERLGVSKSSGDPTNAKPVIYKLDNPKLPELMLHYRLASQYCFWNYFLLEEELGRLSQDELEGFLQEIRESKIPKESIRKLDESGLLPQLLYALEGQKMLATKAMSDCYIKTLIHMANSPLKNLSFSSGNAYDFPHSIYVGIYRCLLFYCQDINVHLRNGENIFGIGANKVGDMLLPVFSEEFDVLLTALLIGNDAKYQKGHIADLSENAFFAPKDYEKLCKLYLERIEQFQREGRLVGHVEFFELFRCWRILLREYMDPSLNDRFREACQSMTHDVQAINSMIIFFCTDNRKFANPPCLIVTIRLDDLTNAFGEEGVQAILATLNAADKLPEYTCKAWVALRWALEHKGDNKTYNEEETMNRLKALYSDEPYQSEMAAKMLEKESA